jgi:hypothetical protein
MSERMGAPGGHPLARCLVGLSLVTVTLGVPAVAAVEFDARGDVGIEYRWFTETPRFPELHGNNVALYAEPEFAWTWAEGDQRIVLRPFLRWDQGDPERTHMDLREAYWRINFGRAELRVGARKVYWGVTESLHLVDIINQTDLVEDSDTEDKFGQPMVNLALFPSWGTVEIYLMPLFRERSFPGVTGRPRGSLRVDTDQAVYQSPDAENHLDWAARWSHYIGDFDIGVSYFRGTSRDPRFELGLALDGLTPVLIPNYDLIEQVSLDLQATKGDFLWKFEAISRVTPTDGRYFAMAGGFEFTLYGVTDGGGDLGLLVEYLYDQRGDTATTPFEDDLFIGARLALNDVQSTELLAGVIIDNSTRARVTFVEGSRRLGDSWRMALTARLFSGISYTEPLLLGISEDDYVEFSLARYW